MRFIIKENVAKFAIVLMVGSMPTQAMDWKNEIVGCDIKITLNTGAYEGKSYPMQDTDHKNDLRKRKVKTINRYSHQTLKYWKQFQKGD
jgi:hypothetical protein